MLSSAVAVGYLRKSVAGRRLDDDKDLQRAAITAMAERDGLTVTRMIDTDWGRSGGRHARESRSGMAELIREVRAGNVRTIYAYALDRLARDTEYGLSLWNAAADQGVNIVVDGAKYDTSDPADRMRFVVMSEIAAGELDRITKRNRDKTARARIEGRSVGGILPYGHDPVRHPGEDPAVVVDAYRETGSYNGAANRLNDAGIRARRGGLWTPRSVLLVVEREQPDIARRFTSRKGVSQARTRIFSGLLTCHCGAVLTAHTRPGRVRRDGTIGPSSNAYICKVGRVNPRHGHPVMVSEPTILRWAMDEAAKLRIPYDAVEIAKSSETKRQAVRDRLARYAEMYGEGTIDRARYDAEKARAQRDLDALDVQRVVVALPRAIDWSMPAPKLNAVLRSMWTTIHLDSDLRAIDAEWTVPWHA